MKGHLAKGVFKTMGKRRRISLEVHRIPIPKIPSGLDIVESDSEEEEEKGGDGDDDYDDGYGGHHGQGSFVEKTCLRLSKKISGHKEKVPKMGKSSSSVMMSGSASDSNHGAHSSSSVLVVDDDDDVSSVATFDAADNNSIFEFPEDSQYDIHDVFTTPLAAVDENISESQQQQSQPNTANGQKAVEFRFEADTLPEQLHNNHNYNRQQLGFSTVIHKEKWQTKYKFDVSDLKIIKVNKNKVTLQIKSFYTGNSKSERNDERTIHFNSATEASDFSDKLEKSKRTDSLCKTRNYEKAVRGLNITNQDVDVKIDFLIEIVGAEKLVVSGEFVVLVLYFKKSAPEKLSSI